LAVRELDDPHDPEDQRQPEGDEHVDPAHRQPVQRPLDCLVSHGRRWRSSAMGEPVSRSAGQPFLGSDILTSLISPLLSILEIGMGLASTRLTPKTSLPAIIPSPNTVLIWPSEVMVSNAAPTSLGSMVSALVI